MQTAAYTESVKTANADIEDSSLKTWSAVQTCTNSSLDNMGSTANKTYGKAATQSESMWERMVTAAENGAVKIIEAFGKIAIAAKSASSASISVSGPDIPHNAAGTGNFEGGWTHINENGGELAFLPSGSAIIPADKTDRILPQAAPETFEARQPRPGWQPVLIERDPLGGHKDDPDPDSNDPNNPKNPKPDPQGSGGAPPLTPAAGGNREIVVRKILEVHVTSDNGALSREAEEQIKQMINSEMKQLFVARQSGPKTNQRIYLPNGHVRVVTLK